MAQLTYTALETHPTGTAGLNEIINGNWQRVEEIFTPGLASGDAAYNLVARGLLRDALGSMTAGETIVWNGSKFARRPASATLTYAASVALPFASGAAAPIQILALTGNVTLTTSNLTAGGTMRVVISADASSRNFTFPAWRFIGSAAPASIAASKIGILTLVSTTTADTGVIARWEAEP
jgi:hypothetical protein